MSGAARGLSVSRPLRARVLRQVALPLALGAAGWGLIVATQRPAFEDDGTRIARMTATGCAYDTRSDAGSSHVDEPAYSVEPPAGGDHRARPAEPGIYSADAAPPDGELVHALEHGAVVVWLGPGLGASEAETARELYRQIPGVVIVVERPGLAVQLAATAWGRRLLCRSADVAAVRDFVCAFNRRGPERVGPQVRHGCAAA